MEARTRAFTAYGQAAQTLPPSRQIIMLYDGAIERLRAARQAIEGGRIEERFQQTQKAAAIINGLHGCLDFERGGEIAPLLDRFYTYASLRLQLINTRNDPGICDELIARLRQMREAWARAESPDATTPARLPTATEPASLSA